MATHPQQHNPGNEEQLPVALVPTTPAPLATDLVVVGATQPPQPPQPQPHHVRSDSSFSMDSFVMDVVTNNNSNAAMDPDLDARLTLSFSSSNTNANNNNTSQQQQQYETIDPPQLRIRADSGMSYDSNVQPPPVHPFFLLHGAGAGTGSGNEFDGHNSDGSIVFKPATATTINPDNNYNNFSNSPTKHVRQPTQPQQQQRLPTKGVAGSNTNNSNTNSTTSTGSSSHHLFRRRDRFPSFDSAGSSGSVIKKAMAPTMTTTTTTLRSTPAPDKILLPYHERRKLLQQRQKQQQQSQHQQSQHQQSQQYRDQTPPRPGLQPPYRTTSTSSGTSSILPQQQLPLSTDDMPLHASLSFSAVKTIQQPQHSTNHPHRMAHPNDGGYRSMSQTPTQQQQLPYNLQSSPMPSQNYTYPPATSEMAHHAVHPAASHINPSDHRRERTGQTMQQQSVPQFLYQQSLDYASRLDPPPEEQALQSTLLGLSPRLPSATTAPTLPGHQKASEPAAASNTNNYDVGADPYPTSSSFDSSVGLDHWVQSEVRYGNHANNTGRARSTSHTPRHKAPPTPPPPPPPSTKPPPLRPSVLVRQGSGGSISSLGSIDRSGRPETIRPKDDPGGGLFARLNPWASPPPPKETSNVGDFHSKNQAFLSKIERFNTLNSPSPRQMIQRQVIYKLDLLWEIRLKSSYVVE